MTKHKITYDTNENNEYCGVDLEDHEVIDGLNTIISGYDIIATKLFNNELLEKIAINVCEIEDLLKDQTNE